MDSFELNKILGAVLGTLLVVMSLGIVSEMIFEREAPEEPGYAIAAVAPEHGGEAGGGEAAAEVVSIAVLLRDADPDKGAQSAKKCQACHTFEKGGPARVGPNLWGVVGGPMAHMDGFNYSDAMMGMHNSSEVWTFEKLNEFLANPKAAVPGTAMAFAGLKRDDERANVIAYLRTLSDNPVPLPEVQAEAAATEGAAPSGEAAPATEATPSGETPAAGDSSGQMAPESPSGAMAPEAPAPSTGTMSPQAPPVVPAEPTQPAN